MMKKLLLLGALCALLGCFSAANADTLLAGDGEAFDSLTAALAAARDGDTILLVDGVYDQMRETFPIMVDKRVAIRAQEGATPVIRSPKLAHAMKITASGASVDGVTFAFLRSGLWALADDITVTRCAFTLADERWRTSSCGMWAGGAKRLTLRDNQFTGCGVALAGPPQTPETGHVPVLTAMFEVGEDAAFFDSHTIENNTVNGKPLYYYANGRDIVVPTDAGGLIAACCRGLTVDELDVSDSSMGVQIVHCEDVTINNTRADRCGVFGVYLAYTKGAVVERVVSSRSNHAIDLRSVHGATVTDCQTVDCEQGIFLSWAYDSAVTGCQMIGCGNGFFIASGERNALLRSLARGNENGVYLQGEHDMLLCENEIAENTVAGVRVLRSSAQVVSNVFHDDWTGLLATECEPLTVACNTFRGERSAALYMKDISGGKIVGNAFFDKGKAYLETDDATVSAILNGNMYE